MPESKLPSIMDPYEPSSMNFDGEADNSRRKGSFKIVKSEAITAKEGNIKALDENLIGYSKRRQTICSRNTRDVMSSWITGMIAYMLKIMPKQYIRNSKKLASR